MAAKLLGLNVCSSEVVVQGRLCRVAHVDGDGYKFLNDLEEVVTELRRSRAWIELFIFQQKLPQTTPKYRYLLEWDKVAALPSSTVFPFSSVAAATEAYRGLRLRLFAVL